MAGTKRFCARRGQSQEYHVLAFTEDLALNSGVLDPLGATHAPGADAYFQTLKQLAATLRECLSAP